MSKVYIFSKNPEKLLEMLALRRAGFSFDFLSELYNCDRTTLRYQCRKYQIFPVKTVFIRNDKSPEIYNPKRIIKKIIEELYPERISNWTIVDGERINTGKSYADYLKTLSPYKKSIF